MMVILTTWSSAVLAADAVRVRLGAHDAYSRLVFDWLRDVEYRVVRDGATVNVEFKNAAAFDLSSAKTTKVGNIEALEILSSDPARVQLRIPAESRIRDLKIDKKVIIDVYNPAGGKGVVSSVEIVEKVEEPKVAAVKVEEKVEEPVEVTPETKTEPESIAEGEAENASEITELPPAESALVEPQEAESASPVKLEMREEPSLVTISSTNNFGMAAFELRDKIWLVNDRTDALLTPQVSGPLAAEFKPIEEISATNAKVFTINTVDNKVVQGKGGGVLWRLFVSGDLDPKAGKEPKRVGVERGDARSGKLLWPLEGARTVVALNSPYNGQKIFAVTVTDADQFAGEAREFVDFDVLPSPIGLNVVSKVDDLKVEIVRGGVEISRPNGLSLVDEALLKSMRIMDHNYEVDQSIKAPANRERIFDFAAWTLGGITVVQENRRVVLSGLKDQPENSQSESILTLGKMYLANGMGAEALGALEYAARERSGLWDSPEFGALFGAASTLTHHNLEAYNALSKDALKPFEEVQFWRALVLADEGDWQQAYEIFPKNLAVLYDYPVLLQNRIFPDFAEIMLRGGDLTRATILLDIAESNKKDMTSPQRAALQYLQGEAARQAGKLDVTKKLWENLASGRDDMYRAKAGLALTRLQLGEKEITSKQAIDNLERLRYAWRGDELEVQINYWLGRTYFDDGEYLKGLKIMRDAVSYDDGTPLGRRVAGDMADMFAEVLLSDRLSDVSPLNAISIYDEFKELVPLDEKGNKITERLAEHLADADLLDRAGDLLKYQLDHRLEGSEIYRIGVRVAALRLLDNQTDAAIDALNVAADNLDKQPEEFKTKVRYQTIALMRARAASQKGRPDQALESLNTLEQTPAVNRLRADIAWRAAYWDDAAEALGDVVLDENMSLTRPLSDAHAALLMQRAVAMNLAGDRVGLANIREKYTDSMAQTAKFKVFEVITRPRQSGALSNRETLMNVVSEVDLFKDFLTSYKSEEVEGTPVAQ